MASTTLLAGASLMEGNSIPCAATRCPSAIPRRSAHRDGLVSDDWYFRTRRSLRREEAGYTRNLLRAVKQSEEFITSHDWVWVE